MYTVHASKMLQFSFSVICICHRKQADSHRSTERSDIYSQNSRLGWWRWWW